MFGVFALRGVMVWQMTIMRAHRSRARIARMRLPARFCRMNHRLRFEVSRQSLSFTWVGLESLESGLQLKAIILTSIVRDLQSPAL